MHAAIRYSTPFTHIPTSLHNQVTYTSKVHGSFTSIIIISLVSTGI